MDDNNTLERADTLSAEIDDVIMMLSMTHTITNAAGYLDEFMMGLERIATTANASGYSEIVKTSQWCQHNLALFTENPSQQINLFIESGECWHWLELISAYLADSAETSYASALSTELLRNEWLIAYKEEDLQALLLQLKLLAIADENDYANANTNEQSMTSSLTFTWDDDTHPEFLEAFFEETTELIGELATLLQKIANGELDSEERYNASRVAHTIKGGSAVAGITALSTLSYRLEKILDYSVKNELAKEIYPLLAETSHCLEDLFQAIQELTGEPSSFSAVFTKLSSYAETLEEDTAPLTLGKPKLPDFITQQAVVEPTVDNTADQIINVPNVFDVPDDEHFDEVVEDIAEDVIEENITCVEIDAIITTLSNLSADNTSRYANYIDELKYLNAFADISGYSEITNVSQWVQRNFVYFDENKQDRSAFIRSGECWLWLKCIRDILADAEEPSHLAELTTELMRDDWAIPFEISDLQNLLMRLKERYSDSKVDAETDTKEVTSVEIAALEHQFSWDDDLHPELLSSYLNETPDQVTQVARLLKKISKGAASKAEHQEASRIAHTIKGASGVVGIAALVEFTHKLEDILDYSINHTLPDDIARLLAESADCLEDMFDAILNKESAPDEFVPLLASLTQYSGTLEQDSVMDMSLFELAAEELPEFINNNNEQNNQIAPIIVEPTIVEEEIETKQNHIDDALFNHHQEPDFSALVNASEAVKSSVDDNKQALSTADSYIRVPVNIIDKLFTLVGELVTTSIQVTDKLDKSIATSKQVKIQDIRVHKMLDELSSTLSKQEKEQFKIIASLQQDNGFDHLEMDTYNELHSINGLLTESILDAEETEAHLEKQLYALKDDLHTLDLLNKDLSDVILKSRMVSINSLVPRLERIVRQTSNKTKKKAELVVTGNEINVDTDILNGLTDPLLHLLRNAIDHGIEYPIDREAKNKDKTGQITLEFSRKGSQIQMQLKDDGAGMDAEKIYQQAIAKGLIAADKKLSKDEKLQLILQAGFSTQRNVTDISGRGVGMYLVNNAVRTLNGTLSIESEVGKGTIFTISIPLTLVTSTTLLVNVSGHQVAIPSESIEQLYYLTPESVIKSERGYFVAYEGRELPIQSLATLIGFPASTPDFSQSHTLLLIKSAHETHAVYIDEVISSRQTVIKSLSDWLDSSQGLLGACHLPDGGVAPVVNLPKILNLNEKTNQLIKQIQLDSAEQTVKETVAKILVVDDSLSNRKALSLIIDQTEFDVLTAVDGLDALQIMNENQIDLVFTDLEMPRMNGIELTQAIRVWEDKKDTPVVMITSRTTSKHRKLAEKAGVDDYLTKPVITETLLNSISQWLEKATV
jgi:chemosensory pili system protein ChpA (sensor histidine kinase/response regulator)